MLLLRAKEEPPRFRCGFGMKHFAAVEGYYVLTWQFLANGVFYGGHRIIWGFLFVAEDKGLQFSSL